MANIRCLINVSGATTHERRGKADVTVQEDNHSKVQAGGSLKWVPIRN